MKTVRFSQVVAVCGKPGVHLMLVAPEKDRALMALVKKTRVMTVHQAPRGTRKDYGTVGLFKTPGSQLLIFPRSLKPYADKRVVGIHYDQLASPPGADIEVEPKVAAPRKEAKSKIRKTSSRHPKAEVLPFTPEPVFEPEPEPVAAPPPTRREILAEVQAARRLLGTRKLVAARERLAELAQRIEADPELD